MEVYTDFLTYLNDSMIKLKERLEKVTILHSEIAVALLETTFLYNPQVLIDLTEMVSNGRKFDRYIIEGQEMKAQLENLLTRPKVSTDDYRVVADELKKIVDSLNSNFDVDITKVISNLNV